MGNKERITVLENRIDKLVFQMKGLEGKMRNLAEHQTKVNNHIAEALKRIEAITRGGSDDTKRSDS